MLPSALPYSGRMDGPMVVPEWVPVWEDVTLRLAGTAAAIAAGIMGLRVIWQQVIVRLFHRYRRMKKATVDLAAEISKIRAHTASMNETVQRELTTNGGTSAVDKINVLTAKMSKLERDQMRLAGSIVAFLFRHDAEFDEAWEYLRDEYGVDRRDEPPPD